MKKYSLQWVIGVFVLGVVVGGAVFGTNTRFFKGSVGDALPSVTTSRCMSLQNWMQKGTLTANLGGDLTEWRACERYYPGIIYGNVNAAVCERFVAWRNEGTLSSHGGYSHSQATGCAIYYPEIWYGRVSGMHCRRLRQFRWMGVLTDYLRFHQQPELSEQCAAAFPAWWHEGLPSYTTPTPIPSTGPGVPPSGGMMTPPPGGSYSGGMTGPDVPYPGSPTPIPAQAVALRLFEEDDAMGYDLQFHNNNGVVAAFGFKTSTTNSSGFKVANIKYSDKTHEDVSGSVLEGGRMTLQARDNSGTYTIWFQRIVPGYNADIVIWKNTMGTMYPGGEAPGPMPGSFSGPSSPSGGYMAPPGSAMPPSSSSAPSGGATRYSAPPVRPTSDTYESATPAPAAAETAPSSGAAPTAEESAAARTRAILRKAMEMRNASRGR